MHRSPRHRVRVQNRGAATIDQARDSGALPSAILPAPARRWALFLDLDGTLADIESHPDEVRVPADSIAVLSELQGLLGGALAVVSGRPLTDLDRILAPLQVAAAGLHGIDRRDAGGARHRPAHDGAAVAALRARLGEIAAIDPRLWLEDKGDTLALHYRAAPEVGAQCRTLVRKAVAAQPSLHLLEGKMVLEVKPAGADKGAAVAAFMGEAPFAGRTPVFAGDDVTDEDGFREVLARGGVALKVGDGDTLAGHRIADAAAFRRWLTRLCTQWQEDRRDG